MPRRVRWIRKYSATGEHDAHRRDGQAIDRIAHHLGELDRGARGRPGWRRHARRRPPAGCALLEDQDQAVGQQHLFEVVALVEVAKTAPIPARRRRPGERNAEHDRHHQAAGGAGQHEGQVGADHVETAVRQVDDAHDAEHQRQAACHQERGANRTAASSASGSGSLRNP
jgi:hypothetical protein